jgi:hypothetical protein
MILGMGFLRNAYALYDFGDFASSVKSDTGDPFVQLLSLTDAAKAHKDFVTKRLGGIDTTGDPAHSLLPASQMKHSPISQAELRAQREGKVLRQWPYILVGCLALVALIAGLIIWKCCCGGRHREGCCGCGKRKTSGGHQQRGSISMMMQQQQQPRYQALGNPTSGGYADPYRR